MNSVVTERAAPAPAIEQRRRPRRNLRLRLARAPIGLLIGLLIVVEVYPLVWLLLASFKANSEFTLNPLWALPAGVHWQNYSEAWNSGMSTYFVNSILAVFPALALILVFGVAAGFALQVMRWRGRDAVLLAFVAGILVPLQMLLLPLFAVYFNTGLINTRWALIITYTAFGLPFTVFLMAGYFKAVSNEVLEAAALDGANVYQIFFHVALPIVSNAILTVAVVQFLFLWNDLLFSLAFISSDNMRTIQTGLLSFAGEHGQIEWGPTFASVSLAVFPTMFVYIILNQRVIKGLTEGSLTGN